MILWLTSNQIAGTRCIGLSTKEVGAHFRVLRVWTTVCLMRQASRTEGCFLNCGWAKFAGLVAFESLEPV